MKQPFSVISMVVLICRTDDAGRLRMAWNVRPACAASAGGEGIAQHRVVFIVYDVKLF
jgi:hypothetical protein